ncbi:hypothetical protein [Natrinema sp. 74]|uniref:hypothetical protein n=1 Tax=Natrinema sp. 74 TaxID=3384159 RepID=UPI0038D3B782
MSHSDEAVDVATTSPVPEYVVETSINQWLLIDANRWVVAGLFSTTVFVVFFVLTWMGVIGITAAGPAPLLLSVFIAGNLTLVPITITINQLVLSREFGKPHDLNERDEGVRDLRRNLKDLADVSAIQPTPIAFLRVLVETIEESGESVSEVVSATDDEELQRRAEVVRKQLATNTDRMHSALEDAEFGSFELLSAMLRVNSAWLIGAAEHLQHEEFEPMPAEPFDRLEKTLRMFNVSRQYTKTLYVQREIAALSRLLLYVGFVAVGSSAVAMLVYDASIRPPVSETMLQVAFSLLCAVAFAPLAFLLSYTLRLSTIVSYPPVRNSFITDG